MEDERNQKAVFAEDGDPQNCDEEEEALDSMKPSPVIEPHDPASEAHLSPQIVDTRALDGEVIRMACGSQHSAVLTRGGRLYTMGRNLEGQLGIGNRSSCQIPTLVTAL